MPWPYLGNISKPVTPFKSSVLSEPKGHEAILRPNFSVLPPWSVALFFDVPGPVFLLPSTSLPLFLSENRLHSFETQRLLYLEKSTDSLTGLKNSRSLFEEIHRFPHEAMPPRAIFMLGLDYFKHIHDAYGCSTGDACLRAFGQLFSGPENHFPPSVFSLWKGGVRWPEFLEKSKTHGGGPTENSQ